MSVLVTTAVAIVSSQNIMRTATSIGTFCFEVFQKCLSLLAQNLMYGDRDFDDRYFQLNFMLCTPGC